MELFSFYQHIGVWTSLIVALAIWDLVWKAIALWRASKRQEVIWFVLILVLNTMGILPILYLILKPAPGKKPLVETVTSKTGVETKKVAKKKTVSKKSATKKTKKTSKTKASSSKK